MPQINGEPEPTRAMDEDEISFSNRHFDWRGRNQYPLPPAPPMRPDPTITPGHPCDFGAFDFVWRWVLRVIDWLNRRTGAGDKPKRKTNSEQMMTFEELFDGYDDVGQGRETIHYQPPLPPYPPTRDATRR